MKVRIIIASNENGSHEEVHFTEDFETPAEDFFFNLEVSQDKICECELPSTFPLGYNLKRT